MSVNSIADNFFNNLNKYTHKETKILVIFASFEDINIIKDRLSKTKYKWNEISEKRFGSIVWYMYENY